MDFLAEDERDSTAFIIEVTGPCAALIIDERRNAAFSYFTPHSPKSLWYGTSSTYTREQTPTEAVDRETKVYLRLPWTEHHHRFGYIFGRGEDVVHFKLPSSLGKAISSVHFRLFLGKYVTWMIESLSSNGTMYLGLLRQFEQRALHPDEPNEIRIGDLRLLVHIPNESLPCQLKYGSYPPDFTESLVQTPPASVRSSSISVVSMESSRTSKDEASGYHVCSRRSILPEAPTKCMAVRIRDGRLCVLKSYQGTEAQYTQVLGPSRRCESIVTYFEYLENGPLGPTIITEHIREAQILEERLADGALNTMVVELMYGQIVDALRFLEVSDLIHRDIRPGTILSSPLGFWLTGFSTCILGVATERWTENPQFGAPEVQAGGRYDSRSDIYSLCMVCNYCISPGGSSDEMKRTLTYIGDPVVGSLLTTGIGDQTDQRQFASQIHSYLEKMMGHRLEIPFRSFFVVKKRHLVAMEYEGGEWIRANDLLDAAYTEGCSGEEDMASYLRQAKVINKEEYLPLRAARKFCHRYRLEAFANRLRSKTQSQVFKDAQTVYYHAPSLMYNIDQLLRVAGIEAASSCMELFPPDSRQEVQGVKAWEGTYIDNKTFKNIAKLLTNKYGITIHQRQKAPNDILASRFTCTAAKETIILVTKYFQYNMLHMRRLDGFVNWDPFSSESRYMSMADAIAKCTDLNLSELKATISDLERRSRDFQWPLPHLICEVDFDSDATSILTKSSWSLASNSDESEDELKFKFRKSTLKAIAEKNIPSVQSS